MILYKKICGPRAGEKNHPVATMIAGQRGSGWEF
jgi:hypothetical protein